MGVQAVLNLCENGLCLRRSFAARDASGSAATQSLHIVALEKRELTENNKTRKRRREKTSGASSLDLHPKPPPKLKARESQRTRTKIRADGESID